MTRKRHNTLPKGWTDAKVARVLSHYERQTPEQAAAEDEASYHNRRETLMTIPVRLVPKVRHLLAGGV